MEQNFIYFVRHNCTDLSSLKVSINGTQFMFGVEIPCNVKHALKLDKANGNMLWKDSIDVEVKGINPYQ